MARQTKSGSLSQYSRYSLALDMDEFSDHELITLVDDLKEKIKILRLENEILENTILRVEPALLAGVQQAVDFASKMQMGTPSRTSFGRSQSRLGTESLASQSRVFMSQSRLSSRKMSTVKSRGTLLGSGPKINVLEKSELVVKEMELAVENLEKFRKNAKKSLCLLKAQLEEVASRVESTEADKEAFTQQVIYEGLDTLTQRIPAEIWVRFLKEWVKSTDYLIDKFRLRTGTLDMQYGRLKSQVPAKQELSENLRPVDFEKIAIQNSVCRATINEKIAALVELKKFTGDANLNLTVHKNLMADQNSYLTKVIDTIKKRKKRTIDMNKERSIIAAEADKYNEKLKKIRHFVQKYEVPSIMDYVYVTAELDNLKFNIKMLSNRYHVQVISLSSLNKQLKNKPIFESLTF